MKRFQRSLGSIRAPDPADCRELTRELELVAVYEDACTEHWARQVEEMIVTVAGGICRRSWKLGDLRQPGALGDAARATARADVIVVSVHDRQELPQECSRWVGAWLPHRLQVSGALVGLIVASGRTGVRSDLAEEYLRGIARGAGLDFFSARSGFGAAPEDSFSLKPKVEVLRERGESHDHGHFDHGLNE
jgi:hypothetical protein